MSATTTTVDAPKTSEEEGVTTGATTTGQAPAPASSGAALTPKTDAETRLTQADVDRIVETRLAEERRKNEAQVDRAKKAAAEKAAVESGEWKALYEGAKETIAKLEAKIETAQLDTMRERVAAKHKLPPQLAARLRGTDEASLDADAKELAKLVAPPAAGNTELGKGNGQGGARTVEQIKEELRKSGRYASVG